MPRHSSPIGWPHAPYPRGARQPDPLGCPGTTPLFQGGRLFSALVALAVVTWQVLVHGPLARLDERVSRALVDTVPGP